VVWARGDLNFVGADLRTVHNMNVKQGVVLQELIAKELTVADALEEVCAQCDGGELTTREKRMLFLYVREPRAIAFFVRLLRIVVSTIYKQNLST
jgi:hypothetical protein